MISENRAEIKTERILYRLRPVSTYRQDFRKSNSLVFYIKGGHRFDFGDYTLEASEGNMLYIPYGSAYSNEVTSKNTEYYQVDFNFLNKGTPGPVFEKARVFDREASIKYLPIFRDIYKVYSLRKSGYGMLCMSSILKITGMILSEDSTGAEALGSVYKIENTLNHINENYHLDTSVEELALMSSMSVSNLEKIFKKNLGLSPLNYRHRIRIDHAKLFLAGGYSISETAERVGYKDVYYFSRMFKKLCGITPGAFVRENSGI